MNDPKSFVEPLAGFALDCVSLLRNRPFVPHSLLKLKNIRTCRDLSGAATAIEIGTYRGLTASRMSKLFDSVISVEIDDNLYSLAKQRCKELHNVELLHGDGTALLPSISARVSNALIFFDGHFSGGGTGQGVEPEPIINELALIEPHLENFVAIIVDDFRLFGVEPGWPRKSEVFGQLERLLSSDWYIGVLNDQIIAVRSRGKMVASVPAG